MKKGRGGNKSRGKGAQALPSASSNQLARLTSPPEKTKPTWLDQWKSFWAVVGPVITVFTALYAYRPSITVETSVNLNPAETLATQLLIKNVGKSSVRDVRFVVELRGSAAHFGEFLINPVPRISELAPGAWVSRALTGQSVDVRAPYVLVKVSYGWPFNWYRETRPFWFTIAQGGAGNFLVPAEPPAGNPMILLRYGDPEDAT